MIKTVAMRVSNPHLIWDLVTIATPIRRRAIIMNTKAAIEAELCRTTRVRGKMPMAGIIIEPRIRLLAPNCPSLLDRKLFLKPTANIKLSIPVKTYPKLNRVAAEPIIPRSQISFSVQLNHGELEIAIRRTTTATIWEVIPQIPAILLSTVTPLLGIFRFEFSPVLIYCQCRLQLKIVAT